MSASLPMTITEARDRMDRGELSAEGLLEGCLGRIRERNADVFAYLEVFEDEARAAARAADARRGEKAALSPLDGVPIAIKDNILIAGKRATAGSRILESYVAAYDATVVARLREAGAVIVGRTNLDEFAMGSSTEHSAFGPTKNPLDLARVPGGSSGGSAAAVAMGGALAALGSDTGGSIRQPAAFTGLVGLKPTYGAVSRFGLVAMSSSLDQIGPLARSVADAELLFRAIAGPDPKDSTSLPAAPEKEAPPRPIVGVPRAYLSEGVDADVLSSFEAALSRLAAAGAEIRDVELPNLSLALPAYYVVMPAEASTNLARFDGVRYGLRRAGGDLLGDYRKTRGAGFGPEPRRRILLGTYVLSAGYYDAYYAKATAARSLIAFDFETAFRSVDLIATPTTPTPAFRLGEKADPLSMYLSDIFTVPANLAGVPAISIPMGDVSRGGVPLPVGLQLVAPRGGEAFLFSAAGKFLGEKPYVLS